MIQERADSYTKGARVLPQYEEVQRIPDAHKLLTFSHMTKQVVAELRSSRPGNVCYLLVDEYQEIN
jgi:hypothetical protein